MTTTRNPKAPSKTPRTEPWERQPAETDPAWEAFKTYRDMGLTRSTAKAARALSKSKQLLDGWSSKHSWVVRVSAYDSNIDREWLLDQREMRRKAARRNATTAALTIQKFGQFISQLDPSKVKAQDIARLAEVAAKLEKDALGVPTNVNLTATANGAVDTDTIAGLSDEERQARLRMLVREAQSRLEDPDAVHDGLHEEDDDD